MKNNENRGSSIAILSSIISYLIWSLFPIYWKLVDAFPPMLLLAFRMFFSFIVIIFITIFTKNYKNLYISKRYILTIIVAAVFLSSNWYLYIYAITTNRVLDASLAYYISPIVSMLFGIIIFREKKTMLEYSAIIFAIIAIMYKTISLGRLPSISLGIAITMSIFNIMKKITRYNEVKSTMLETSIMVIPAIIYICKFDIKSLDVATLDWVILSLSGIITTVPLLLFSKATKILDLSTIGFLQFIVPITATILAIFLYKEAVSRDTIITFLLIFISVGLYIVSLIKKLKIKELK